MARTGPRSILLVEEGAHRHAGHFPVRCAQLATAYTELGYQVELLTSEGWSRHPEEPRPQFAVRRYRHWTRQLLRVIYRQQRDHNRAVASVLRSWLLVREARGAARRMLPEPDAIIVLAWEVDPALVAAVAGSGRWLVNQFRDHDDVPHLSPIMARGLNALGNRAETRRRSNGGCMRVAVAFDERRDGWRRAVPYLDPVVAPIAGSRDLARAPDARRQLGLPSDGKIALLFGDGSSKRRELVLEAFALLDDWTLVMGGAVADDLDPNDARCPFRFPGIISNARRDLLYSAADLVVLSFRPDYSNNSGTLMDAMSVGVPVVCPDDATVAEILTRYRLGTTFAAGDADALADAVRRAPARIAPADLAAARQEHSNRAVARCQLLLLGIVHLPT